MFKVHHILGIKQFMFFFLLFIIFIYLTSYSNMQRWYMRKIYKIYNNIQFVYKTSPQHPSLILRYVIFIHAVYCVDPHIADCIIRTLSMQNAFHLYRKQ